MKNDIAEPTLSISDKLSVVNALMAQDRTEIRWIQDSIFKVTYLVIAGFLAIAVYLGKHENTNLSNAHLIAGAVALLVMYLVSFYTFHNWLKDSRACLQIREEFYANNQKLLFYLEFNPIRPIKKEDGDLRFKDTEIWYPFAVTVASAISLILYLYLF